MRINPMDLKTRLTTQHRLELACDIPLFVEQGDQRVTHSYLNCS